MNRSVFIAEGSAREDALSQLSPNIVVFGPDHVEKLLGIVASLNATLKADPRYDTHELRRGLWRSLLCVALIQSEDESVSQVRPFLGNLSTLDFAAACRDYVHQVAAIRWLRDVGARLLEDGRELRVAYHLEPYLRATENQGLLISALVDLWWDLRGGPLASLILLPEGYWHGQIRLCDKAKIISHTYCVGTTLPVRPVRQRKSS